VGCGSQRHSRCRQPPGQLSASCMNESVCSW
jgi:hypothetical protein